MNQGYTFKLSNGDSIDIVPKEGSKTCVVSRPTYSIEFHQEDETFEIKDSEGKLFNVETPSVTKFLKGTFDTSLRKSSTSKKTYGDIHIMTCNMCNGAECCITGGCVRCDPNCDWVCG